MRIVLREHGKYNWEDMKYIGVETVQTPTSFLMKDVLGLTDEQCEGVLSLQDLEERVAVTHIFERIFGYVNGGPISFDTEEKCKFDSVLLGYAVMSLDDAEAKYGNKYEDYFYEDVTAKLELMTVHCHGPKGNYEDLGYTVMTSLENIEEDILESFVAIEAILENPNLSDDEKGVALYIAEDMMIAQYHPRVEGLYERMFEAECISGRLRVFVPHKDILFDVFGGQIGIIVSEDLISVEEWPRYAKVTLAALRCAFGDVKPIDNMLGIKNSIGWDSLI